MLEMDSAAPRHSLSRGVGEQGPSYDLAPPRRSPTEKTEDIEVKEPEAEILDMEGSTAARENSVSRGAGGSASVANSELLGARAPKIGRKHPKGMEMA